MSTGYPIFFLKILPRAFNGKPHCLETDLRTYVPGQVTFSLPDMIKDFLQAVQRQLF